MRHPQSLQQAAKKALQEATTQNPQIGPNDRILLKDVVIFHTGDFNGEKTEQKHLKSIVAAIPELKENNNFEPFIKITHKKQGNHPNIKEYAEMETATETHPYAHGEVINVSQEDSKLIGDLNTFVYIAKLINDKKLRSLSPEILHELKDQKTNKSYARALNAVALMGSDREAAWSVLNQQNYDLTVPGIDYKIIKCYKLIESKGDLKKMDMKYILKAIAEKLGIKLDDIEEKQREMVDNEKEYKSDSTPPAPLTEEEEIEENKKYMGEYMKKDKMEAYELKLRNEIAAEFIKENKSDLEAKFRSEYELKNQDLVKKIEDLEKKQLQTTKDLLAQEQLKSDKEFVYQLSRPVSGVPKLHNHMEGPLLSLLSNAPEQALIKQVNYSLGSTTKTSNYKEQIKDFVNLLSVSMSEYGINETIENNNNQKTAGEYRKQAAGNAVEGLDQHEQAIAWAKENNRKIDLIANDAESLVNYEIALVAVGTKN